MSQNRPFYSSEEIEKIDSFLEKGYLIFDVEQKLLLENLLEKIDQKIRSYLGPLKAPVKDFLNENHRYVEVADLNRFRLNLIDQINAEESLLADLYHMAKNSLSLLVGSELAMQRRANLSIQQPGDNSSLLDIHTDVWSGNSPYEVVFWLPLVHCYGTKSFYILPRQISQKVIKDWHNYKHLSSEEFFKRVEKDIIWFDLPLGKAVLFSHSVFHGNRVNLENETRWSINVRFKSLLSPYHEKSLAETFLPITPKAATLIGYDYRFPAGEES